MTREATRYREPAPELRHRPIPSGDARVAVFTRTYDATVEDLWDACTNPARLRRWYTPVTGDLHVGGSFTQMNMASGEIVECEAPHRLKLSLAGGKDEIELRLAAGAEEGTTTLELQHATTLESHEIGGQVFDAIFCMGGGYYPRLLALDLHMRGELPDNYDSAAFHLEPSMRPIIERGSVAMSALLEAQAANEV